MARRLDDAHRGPGPGLDEFDRGLIPQRLGGGLQTTNVPFKSANGPSSY